MTKATSPIYLLLIFLPPERNANYISSQLLARNLFITQFLKLIWKSKGDKTSNLPIPALEAETSIPRLEQVGKLSWLLSRQTGGVGGGQAKAACSTSAAPFPDCSRTINKHPHGLKWRLKSSVRGTHWPTLATQEPLLTFLSKIPKLLQLREITVRSCRVPGWSLAQYVLVKTVILNEVTNHKPFHGHCIQEYEGRVSKEDPNPSRQGYPQDGMPTLLLPNPAKILFPKFSFDTLHPKGGDWKITCASATRNGPPVP